MVWYGMVWRGGAGQLSNFECFNIHVGEIFKTERKKKMEVASVNFAGSRANYVNEDKKSSRAGRAIASACLPGLGQICDGRVGTGVAYLAGTVAANVGAVKLYTGHRKEFNKYVADIITKVGKDCNPEQIAKIMKAKAGMAAAKTKEEFSKFAADLVTAMGKKAKPEVGKALAEMKVPSKVKFVGAGLLGLATIGLWLSNVINAGKAHKEV